MPPRHERIGKQINGVWHRGIWLNFRRALWETRPRSHRLAYYSFLARRALYHSGAEIGNDVEVEYGGVRFLVPRGFREVFHSFYLDETEPRTFELMTGLTGDVFVDVGANAGGYTVRLARRFRKVISVEPNPRAADVLGKNIVLNRLSNVQVVQKAISDTNEETTMCVPSSGKTTRSSLVAKYDRGSYFPVSTTTLDDLLKGYDRIDLIKIDAERAEVKVLRGGERALQRTSKLVIETGPWSESEAREILEAGGFEVADLDLKEKAKNIVASKP